MARTSPNSDSVLIEKPSSGNSTNVPISETGTASIGIIVARQFCRNRNTTRITSTIASASVFTNLLDALGNRQRRVERVGVVEIRRESRVQIVHDLPDALGHGKRVRPGRLEHGDADARLAVDASNLLVVQRAQLDAGHVAHAHQRAVGIRTEHDVAELFRRSAAGPAARTV